MDEYTIRNYMIDLLSVLLPTYLKDHSIEIGTYINSKEFILKLKAMTLNRIKPVYVTSMKGEIYSAFTMKKPQYHADIMVALSSAATELISQMNDST